MSADSDAALIERIREVHQRKDLHPSATIAWSLYEANGNSMPDAAISKLRDALNGFSDDLVDLLGAVEGVARFLLLMESRGDSETVAGVSDVLREFSGRLEPLWERVGEVIGDVGSESRGLFSNFVGDGNNRVAPKFGDDRPQGSMKLSDLAPPSGPPPWAKKRR